MAKNQWHRSLLSVCRCLFSFFLCVIFVFNISLLSYSITIASFCRSYNSNKLCVYFNKYVPFFLYIVTFSFFFFFCLHIEGSIISTLFANNPFLFILPMLRHPAIFHFTSTTIILTLVRCCGSLSHISLFFLYATLNIYIQQCTQHTLFE